MDRERTVLRVREFDMERDLPAVEELERLCQVGLSGDQGSGDNNNGGTKKSRKKKRRSGMSLCVEQIGDPLARVRHALEHVMLVAEYGEEVEMVGVIKACIKTVSRGSRSSSKKPSSSSSSAKQQPYVKVAYLLGLRVSPSHRRLGIGTALVRRAEEWCRTRGAAHATMATTASNTASLALFTGRFGYAPFRRPVFLGRPVHAHRLPVPRGHGVFQLPPPLAAAAYARLLPPQDTEFLPADMAALLAHKLTLGTFVAIESDPDPALPPCFAVLSVWDSTRSLRLRVRGAPALLRASLTALRALDRSAPWMRVPSVPDIFRPFGAYLLYGLRMFGPEGPALLRSLCHHAHNVARKNQPAPSWPPTSRTTTRPPPPSLVGAASPATRTSGASRTSTTTTTTTMPPPPMTGRRRHPRAASCSSTPASFEVTITCIHAMHGRSRQRLTTSSLPNFDRCTYTWYCSGNTCLATCGTYSPSSNISLTLLLNSQQP